MIAFQLFKAALKLIGISTTHLYIGLGALVIAAATLYGAYSKGYNKAERECNAAALERRIETLERDLAIAKRANDEAKSIMNHLETAFIKSQDNVQKLSIEVSKRPEAERCLITESDARRLR